MRSQFILSHEVYRKQKWDMLKTIRSETDNEGHQSMSILELQDITNKKKELDKIIIKSIHLAILNDEHEKVFQYLDLINFTQSLNLVIRLCDSLKADQLAHRVNMFMNERVTREKHETQVQQMASKLTAQRNDSTQVSRCMKINEGQAGVDGNGKIDLAKLSMNKLP